MTFLKPGQRLNLFQEQQPCTAYFPGTGSLCSKKLRFGVIAVVARVKGDPNLAWAEPASTTHIGSGHPFGKRSNPSRADSHLQPVANP